MLFYEENIDVVKSWNNVFTILFHNFYCFEGNRFLWFIQSQSLTIAHILIIYLFGMIANY